MAENSGGSSFGDWLGVGKGTEVLADLIKSTFGRVTQSHFIKKDADAKAYEIRALAEAEADGMRAKSLAEAERIKVISTAVQEAAPGTGGITVGQSETTISSLPSSETDRLPSMPVKSLSERTESRMNLQEAIRTQNIESITANAFEDLKDNPPISDEKVNQDWANRFFRYAEDVSSEEMQLIWGKILSGEIKKPGTFSLRTMEVLRALSKDEAVSFSSLANRVCHLNNAGYVLFNIDPYNLPVVQHNKLNEAGLIAGTGDELTRTVNTGQIMTIHCFDHIIQAQVIKEGVTFQFPFTLVTSAGAEISKLVNQEGSIDYLTEIAKSLKDNGAEVNFGLIHERNEDGFSTTYRAYPEWKMFY